MGAIPWGLRCLHTCKATLIPCLDAKFPDNILLPHDWGNMFVKIVQSSSLRDNANMWGKQEKRPCVYVNQSSKSLPHPCKLTHTLPQGETPYDWVGPRPSVICISTLINIYLTEACLTGKAVGNKNSTVPAEWFWRCTKDGNFFHSGRNLHTTQDSRYVKKQTAVGEWAWLWNKVQIFLPSHTYCTSMRVIMTFIDDGPYDSSSPLHMV